MRLCRGAHIKVGTGKATLKLLHAICITSACSLPCCGVLHPILEAHTHVAWRMRRRGVERGERGLLPPCRTTLRAGSHCQWQSAC